MGSEDICDILLLNSDPKGSNSLRSCLCAGPSKIDPDLDHMTSFNICDISKCDTSRESKALLDEDLLSLGAFLLTMWKSLN